LLVPTSSLFTVTELSVAEVAESAEEARPSHSGVVGRVAGHRPASRIEGHGEKRKSPNASKALSFLAVHLDTARATRGATDSIARRRL
jgi:hypothetical protein